MRLVQHHQMFRERSAILKNLQIYTWFLVETRAANVPAKTA